MTDNLIERARFVVQLFRECDAIQLPHKPTEETLLGMINRIERLAAERDALKAELHESRMQAIVDFGKLQKACEERNALKAEVERLQGENDLMCAQLDSLPPPEPGLLKRRLLEIAEKKYSAAQQENTAHCKGD